MNIITRECVEPFKPSIPARLALSRVELVDQLYDRHGLNNRSDFPDGNFNESNDRERKNWDFDFRPVFGVFKLTLNVVVNYD